MSVSPTEKSKSFLKRFSDILESIFCEKTIVSIEWTMSLSNFFEGLKSVLVDIFDVWELFHLSDDGITNIIRQY